MMGFLRKFGVAGLLVVLGLGVGWPVKSALFTYRNIDFGFININKSEYFRGKQAGLIANCAWGDMEGAQTGILIVVPAFVNLAETLTGVQYAIFFNKAETLLGFQLGIVNRASSASGFQFGLVNTTKRTEGLQIGLVNVSSNLQGLQIGLINVAPNGFLPVFPLFNIGPSGSSTEKGRQP